MALEYFKLKIRIFTYTETVVPFCIFLDFNSIVHFINIGTIQKTVQTAVQAMNFVKSVSNGFATFVAHLNFKFSFKSRNKIGILPISMNLQYFLLCKHYLKLFLKSTDDEHRLYIVSFVNYGLFR